jgi:membrane-associated phospholipid phosphatase
MDSATADAPQTERERRRGARVPRLRAAALVCYLLALGTACVVRGIPTSRDALFLWLLLGLLAASVGNVRGWLRGVVVDWLPLAAVLFAYDLLRGYADEVFAAHVWPQLRADELLFGGTAPTVWLQERLWDGPAGIDWLDYGVWIVYLTHFFGTFLLAGCLWRFARPLFRPYAAMVALLAAAGFATYLLFPAVPPWMASDFGHLAPTDRIVRFVSAEAPIDFFGSIWESGARYANDVAAVPSLHAAYALLISLYLWPYAGRLVRVALAAYPVAMGFALVYTAEHYVSDVVAGWAYAAAAYWAVMLVVRRRQRVDA